MSIPLLLATLLCAPAQAATPWAPTDLLAHGLGLDQEAFGDAVALDGNLAAVGVPGKVQDNLFGVGAVHLFEREIDGSWSELVQLSPEQWNLYGDFGASLELEGDWLAVGMPGRDTACPGLLNCRSGSVVLFHRESSGTWMPLPEITPSDSDRLDRFGASVALSGDWLAVGAPGEGHDGVPLAEGNGEGAVYLFRRNAADEWIEHVRLKPHDLESREWFGHSVDLEGDRLIVGAPYFYGLGEQGSLYTFERIAGSWTSTGRWSGANSAPDDEFGFSVSLSGDRVAVGARTQYRTSLFERAPDGSWAETQSFQFPFTEFGFSVSLDSDRLAVGAPLPVETPTVHVYAADSSGVFHPEAVLGTDHVLDGKGLGRSVALDGNRLLAGAPLDFGDGTYQAKGVALTFELDFVQPNPNCDGIAQTLALDVEQTFYTTSGGLRLSSYGSDLAAAAVYTKEVHVLERSGSEFVVSAIVDLPGLGSAAAWASSVAISDTHLAVGAQYEPTLGAGAGSVFLFERSGTNWTLDQQLFGSDTNANDHFGVALAIEGSTLVVGARGASGSGSSSGAAYVFQNLGGSWVETQKLTAPGDGFGEQLALEGDWLAVGDWKSDSFGSNSGAAHLFQRDTSGDYSSAQVLTSPNGAVGDAFGRAIDFHGNQLVIGASGCDCVGVYRLDAGSMWVLEHKLIPPAPHAAGGFGASLALGDGVLVVSAPYSDTTAINGGSLTLFHEVGNKWNATTTVAPNDASQDQAFGYEVLLLGEDVLAGIPKDGNEVSISTVLDPGPHPAPRLSIHPPTIAPGEPFA